MLLTACRLWLFPCPSREWVLGLTIQQLGVSLWSEPEELHTEGGETCADGTQPQGASTLLREVSGHRPWWEPSGEQTLSLTEWVIGRPPWKMTEEQNKIPLQTAKRKCPIKATTEFLGRMRSHSGTGQVPEEGEGKAAGQTWTGSELYLSQKLEHWWTFLSPEVAIWFIFSKDDLSSCVEVDWSRPEWVREWEQQVYWLRNSEKWQCFQTTSLKEQDFTLTLM